MCSNSQSNFIIQLLINGRVASIDEVLENNLVRFSNEINNLQRNLSTFIEKNPEHSFKSAILEQDLEKMELYQQKLKIVNNEANAIHWLNFAMTNNLQLSFGWLCAKFASNYVCHRKIFVSACQHNISWTVKKLFGEERNHFGHLNDDVVQAFNYLWEHGNYELINFLIPHKHFKKGLEHLLRHFCRNGNFEMIKYLVEHGADPNLGSIDCMNPLAHACYGNHTELVKYLLSVGGQVGTRCSDEVQFVARRNGNYELLALFRAHGVPYCD